MQVKCVQAFGRHARGDVAEVPDGAEVSPVYYEPLHSADTPPAPDPEPAAAAAPATAFGQLKGN
jgi:hypothetical protein